MSRLRTYEHPRKFYWRRRLSSAFVPSSLRVGNRKPRRGRVRTCDRRVKKVGGVLDEASPGGARRLFCVFNVGFGTSGGRRGTLARGDAGRALDGAAAGV